MPSRKPVPFAAVLLTIAALPGAPGASESTAPQSMFGFQVGEVRHYALGPPEALLEGESSRWSIEFHHVEDGNGVFDLHFRRTELFGPLKEPTLTRSIWGELTVNELGFPLKVVVGERLTDGDIITEYVYREGNYDKTIRWPETEWQTELTIPRHDREARPSGVFLFLSRVPAETMTAWGDRAFAESLFSNPGLLSLVLSYPVPSEPWEREIVLLTPGALLVRHPNSMWYRLQRSTQMRNAHFDRNKLELGDVAEVEIGGRPTLARRFEIEGPFRDGYVDALGRVLLLEHDPRGEMDKPRHIRLLRPSEY